MPAGRRGSRRRRRQPGAAGRRRRGGGRGGRGGRGGAAAAGPSGSSRCSRRRRSRPTRPNDWNRVEVLVDADVFRSNVNGRGSAVAIDGTTGSVRSGRAPCRRHRRGPVQGPRDQGSRAPDHAGRADRARASARSTSRTSTTAGRRRPATSTTTASLDVTIANRYYLGPSFTESREVYAGQAVQPGEGILAGDGELRVRLHRRRLGRHPRRRIAHAGALRESRRESHAAGRAMRCSRRR